MKPRVLNSGVDSWDVRVSRNREPSAWLLEQLAAWREHRQVFYNNPKDWKPTLEELPEVGTFQVRSASNTYEFVLINPEVCDIRIWNPDHWTSAVGGKTGQLYITFRSRFLQFNGTDAAMDLVQKIENILMGDRMQIGSSFPVNPEFTLTSRMDLFVDIELPKAISYKDVFERFACRARKRDVFMDAVGSQALEEALKASMQPSGRAKNRGKKQPPLLNNKGGDVYVQTLAENSGVAVLDVQKVIQAQRKMYATLHVPEAPVSRVVASGARLLQTAYFGRFGSELYARIYDKLASLNCQGKEYMRDVWAAAGWDGVCPVWRVEFSLSGDFLKATALEVGSIPDLRDVGFSLAAIPALWSYLTGTWLTHHKPTRDTNVSRWELSSFWQTVQGAFVQMQPIVRVIPEPRPKYDQLEAQAEGCLVSMAAMVTSPRYQRGVAVDPETGEVLDPKTQFLNMVFETLNNPDFETKVLEKSKRFGLDPESDTQFSATVRSQNLALGRGS